MNILLSFLYIRIKKKKKKHYWLILKNIYLNIFVIYKLVTNITYIITYIWFTV